MRDKVNETIKHRELFRPFAGSIPEEKAQEYFKMNNSESPFMQFVFDVTPKAEKNIPAVIHPSGSRVQTVTQKSDPLFYQLLLDFEAKTGVPVLLNTSFNDADEPIVCSPEDAIKTFKNTNLDALVIGPFVSYK
jgi:carbamoyltransferase